MSSHKLNSVLHSVLGGDLATLKLAVAAGGDVNATDRDGRTALFQAVIVDRCDLVSELLRSGADAEAKGTDGKTALHLAAIQGRVECARILLIAGAPVDAGDKDGNTPLSDAVFYSGGRGDIIRLLLSHGADPLLRNKHGVSPKELAESISNYDVARFFQ